MAPIRLHVLGALSIDDGEMPIHINRQKAQALLVYLALIGQAHRRDTLTALLWPEHEASRARAELRRCIYTLRKNLGSQILVVEQDTVAIQKHTAALWVDALHFRELLSQPTIFTLRSAVDLYRGELLAGFTLPDAPAFEEWRYFEAESFRAAQVSALERLTVWSSGQRQYDEAIDFAKRRLSMDFLHEPAHRKLMELYAWSGQPDIARRYYEQCRTVLEAELGLPPADETVWLHEQIRSGGLEPETSVFEPDRTWHNLPTRPTPFVGRTAQRVRVAELLANPDCRLLTMVGPGGIGKTRLALRSAQDLVGRFADGVCFVDLASVDSREVLSVIALRELDAPKTGSADPEQRLCDCLAGREMLLVLDSFEHLVESATLLTRLLQHAPTVKLLVTSRERLNLAEEWLEPLEGLTVPPADTAQKSGPNQVASLDDYDATTLFMQSVRRIQSNYVPTREEVDAIADICRLVEGMPLGIELAAAWARSLSPVVIHEEMKRSLDFLATTLRDVPKRHRSMRAAIDHSWSLLPERQRGILRQMSVFRGDFTREAAEKVVGCTLIDLSQLVDRSWLRPRANGRYDLHELMREYCEDRLKTEHAQLSEEPPTNVYRRHCRHYSTLLRKTMPAINDQPGAIHDLYADYGNIQAAWRYVIEKSDPQISADLSAAIQHVGTMMGWLDITVKTLESSVESLKQWLERNQTDSQDVDGVLEALGYCYSWLSLNYGDLGLLQDARRVAEEFSSIPKSYSQAEGKQYWHALSLRTYANVLFWEGRFEEASLVESRALEIFLHPDFTCPLFGRRQGQLYWQAHSYYTLGLTSRYMGDYAEAAQYFDRWLVAKDQMQERRFKGWQMQEYVMLLLVTGDYEQAGDRSIMGLQLSQEFDDRFGIALGHLSVGRVQSVLGRSDLAQEHLRKSLETGRQTGILKLHFESLTELGRCALVEERVHDARGYFEEALNVFERLGEPHSNFMVGVWLGFGWTELGDGNQHQASAMFRKALSSRGQSAAEVMEAIAGLADVNTTAGNHTVAVEYLRLVTHHPYTAHSLRQRAVHQLSGLERSFDLDEYVNRSDFSSDRSLENVLDTLAIGEPVGVS